MSTPPPPDRAAAGRERLAARARRVSRLRRRIVAGTLASFVLAWGVIAFDGSMGVSAQTTRTASTQSSTTTTDKATATATPDNSTTSAPVTTAQS
jgi:hypothetical protein